jgi:hypothetical protein
MADDGTAMPGTGRDDEPDRDKEPDPDDEPPVARAVPHPASMSPARTATAQHRAAFLRAVVLRAGRPASTKRTASHLAP